MPRWQSSQRPLFVRTVWVDGRRHAVLTRDDPALRWRRPSSTGADDTSDDTASDTSCPLADCLVKLRIALHPDSYQGTYSESIFPIHAGSVEASRCYDHDADSLCEETRLPLLGQYPRVYSLDPVPAALLPDTPDQLNPLSERVLQWLDLSGRRARLNTSKEVMNMRPRRPGPVSHSSRPRTPVVQLSARTLDTHQRACLPTTVNTPEILPYQKVERVPLSSCGMEEPPPAPVVQTFEPPRLLRPSSWSHAAPAPASRPQLHIFMPPVDSTSEQ